MSSGVTALVFGLGVAGWIYAQLAKRNGNATPANNVIAAAGVGLITALFLYTFLKFVLHF